MHLKLVDHLDPAASEAAAGETGQMFVNEDMAVLYREEAQRIHSLVRRRFWDKDRVQDLVQTAFLRLLGRDARTSPPIREPRAYLTRIALTLVREEAQAARRRCDALHDGLDAVPGVAGGDPHALLEARDMLDRLDAAMLELEERTREIFMAHRFEGLTYAAIADRMGISVKTVEKHISRALRELHAALEPEE